VTPHGRESEGAVQVLQWLKEELHFLPYHWGGGGVGWGGGGWGCGVGGGGGGGFVWYGGGGSGLWEGGGGYLVLGLLFFCVLGGFFLLVVCVLGGVFVRGGGFFGCVFLVGVCVLFSGVVGWGGGGGGGANKPAGLGLLFCYPWKKKALRVLIPDYFWIHPNKGEGEKVREEKRGLLEVCRGLGGCTTEVSLSFVISGKGPRVMKRGWEMARKTSIPTEGRRAAAVKDASPCGFGENGDRLGCRRRKMPGEPGRGGFVLSSIPPRHEVWQCGGRA